MKLTTSILAGAIAFGAMAKDEGPGTYFEPAKGTANVAEKTAAKPGQAAKTVAFLGGSITEMDGFRPRVMKLLRAKYSEIAFTEIAAGLSSTCSDAGAYRLAEDVLAKGTPDLFICEAAVNDHQDGGFDRKHAIRGMEGIVRHVLEVNPACAVVVGMMVNSDQYDELMKGATPLHYAAHAEVAEHYGAAVADVGSALVKEAKNGGMTWKEYRDCHPSPAGCDLGAKTVMEAIAKAFDPTKPPQTKPLPPPLDAKSYFHGVAVPPDKVKFGAGWQHSQPDWKNVPGSKRGYFTVGPIIWSETPGSVLEFGFTGTAAAAFLTAGPDAGDLEVSVDGGEWRLTRLRAICGSLHYPYVHPLADDLADGPHTIRLRVVAANRKDKDGSVKPRSAVRLHRLFVNGKPTVSDNAARPKCG